MINSVLFGKHSDGRTPNVIIVNGYVKHWRLHSKTCATATTITFVGGGQTFAFYCVTGNGLIVEFWIVHSVIFVYPGIQSFGH